MSKTLKTVLLLALPASGKSEVRRYLKHLSPTEQRDDFHMGPSVQLDDFPYVHLMRRVDDELQALGQGRLYFVAPDKSFQDPRDWGTLIELLNQDYDDVVAKRMHTPASAALQLFERFDAASVAVGAKARMATLDDATRAHVAKALEKEARELLDEKLASYPDTLEGKTLVVEFARGGKHGSEMPLKDPYGYQYSIGRLSDALLEHASILYVWVTPEESRRKNEARTDPNDPGSILHHGVPHDVMMNEYGCDDMAYLEQISKVPGTIEISTRGKIFNLPIGRFDNRVDKTSFLREERAKWAPENVKAVHEGLKGALDKLASFKNS
ncbi:hypothetical protein L6R52_35655 [Myxococcota bacterium]|nr:hypothetical protein [Myxococcota bacterium]